MTWRHGCFPVNFEKFLRTFLYRELQVTANDRFFIVTPFFTAGKKRWEWWWWWIAHTHFFFLPNLFFNIMPKNWSSILCLALYFQRPVIFQDVSISNNISYFIDDNFYKFIHDFLTRKTIEKVASFCSALKLTYYRDI